MLTSSTCATPRTRSQRHLQNQSAVTFPRTICNQNQGTTLTESQEYIKGGMGGGRRGAGEGGGERGGGGGGGGTGWGDGGESVPQQQNPEPQVHGANTDSAPFWEARQRLQGTCLLKTSLIQGPAPLHPPETAGLLLEVTSSIVKEDFTLRGGGSGWNICNSSDRGPCRQRVGERDPPQKTQCEDKVHPEEPMSS
jgi:hypothetical protein